MHSVLAVQAVPRGLPGLALFGNAGPPVVTAPTVWPFTGMAVVAPMTLDDKQYAAMAPLQLETSYVISPREVPELKSVKVNEDFVDEMVVVLYVTPAAVAPGTLPEIVSDAVRVTWATIG